MLEAIKENGGIQGYGDRIASFEETQELIGMNQVYELERKHLPAEALQRKYG